MEEIANLCNEFFKTAPAATLIKPFKIIKGVVIGRIEVETSKDNPVFDVLIPGGYPLGNNQNSIHFVCKEVMGYNHVNLDGSICLHARPDHNPTRKLHAEYNLLLQWIQDYYIDEKGDTKYSYLLAKRNDTTILFDDSNTNLRQHDFGTFTFVSFGPGSRGKGEQIIVNNFDSLPSTFAEYLQSPKNEKVGQGVWFYIKDEPVIERRRIAQNWSDLEPYFDKESINYMYLFHQQAMRQKRRPTNMLVMIGYDIPGEQGTEVHWECLQIDPRHFPVRGVKSAIGWGGEFTEQPLNWCNTANCAYDRYFGRGRLADDLTQSRVLLIGTGAIGSMMAMALARGGLRKLTTVDFDVVGSGNICRSEFDMQHIGDYKIDGIVQRLLMTSPFLDVWQEGQIYKGLPGSVHYEKTREFLQKHDIIFDCSTDMELAYMIDKMKLKNQIVFNLSISNKARELVCVTGRRTVADQKHRIFEKLSPESVKVDFYPEAGCQYPTFEAGYNDVNVLVQHALKIINRRYLTRVDHSTFILRTTETETKFEIEVDEC